MGSWVASIRSWKVNSSRGSISPRRAFRSHSSRRRCASSGSIFQKFIRYIRIRVVRSDIRETVWFPENSLTINILQCVVVVMFLVVQKKVLLISVRKTIWCLQNVRFSKFKNERDQEFVSFKNGT